jgi:3-hydroxyacyl-[acyl-carrier-protein] dehydratase
MPGVLMLQTLVEGSAWLLRATEDFRHSVIALRDARNVKYGNFMQPGNSMIITVEAAEYSPDKPLATFKGKAEADGAQTVSAKFAVTRYNLRDRDASLQAIDERIIAQMRNHYRILRGELDGK